jgi:hypothetical protein
LALKDQVMTDAQSNKLDMYLVVQDFYENNQATIDAVPARATAFGQLVTNITNINTEVAGQSTNTTGVAQDKSALRSTLDDITAVTFAAAKAWALATSNNTLAAEFDYSLTDIQRVKDDTMQGFCNHRITIVNDNLVSLADYGLDAASVTAWQDALNAYVAVLESPRQAINTRHLHTQALKSLFTETSNLFSSQLDPLMLVFKLSDPDIYNAYKQARIIINRSSSSSSPATPNAVNITGNVADADTSAPISNATVTLTSPDSPEPIVTTTDFDGNYSMVFTDVPPDTVYSATLEASAPEYGAESNPIDVEAGNSYTFDFTLTPSAP